MELLFDYGANEGNDELKELIGHIDKGVKFTNLKSDITSATRDLIKIIGQDVYDEAVEAYKKETPTADDKELFNTVRYPIALIGYKNHANSLDVSHSNNGRKIRIDEHEKIPFQWMLDRDNENFERKYYKALDELIEYLDENNATWLASDEYKKTQDYFVRTTADFDEYFPIQSRYLLIKLQPGLRQCETRKIIPIVTKATFDALKTKLKGNTELNESEQLLYSTIKEACVYHALAWAMRLLRVTLFPEGILQSYASEQISTKATQPSQKYETELAAQEFKKHSEEVLLALKKLSAAATEAATDEQKATITCPDFGFDCDDDFVTM